MNDQPPEFTSPPEGFILENQPANTVVMVVSTRNLDEVENADVDYFLSKSDSDNFEIGCWTESFGLGDIFLHSTLDRETFSSDPDLGEAASFTID